MHAPTSEDYDQGHRQGTERHFTERHERSRPTTGLFSAKVRWGDKQGGYGEHYWDLNHAGAGDDGHNDDGYSNSHDHDHDRHSDSYDDSPHYGNDDSSQYESGHQHEADRLSNYDEPSQYDADGSRSKRAHSRVKTEKTTKRKVVTEKEDDENDDQREKNHERLQTASTQIDKKSEATPRRTHVYRGQINHKRAQYDSPSNEAAEKVKEEQSSNEGVESYTPALQKEEPQFVPYERGAGIRQHQNQLAAASVPRLFLEPSTGHVVDRATGQAYVLQPIIVN
ncbi:hypothetical protein EVAR_5750_1 [Eumeta japonica]|uniref:Uncharacterized protein n=1 Tax=Eumeta variegata TaxID=151549 RepID=A0A4C1T4H1_EUMVA|nr:hypothetical protein EVAR_5750_1 [Eumeta japonica]